MGKKYINDGCAYDISFAYKDMKRTPPKVEYFRKTAENFSPVSSICQITKGCKIYLSFYSMYLEYISLIDHKTLKIGKDVYHRK